MRKIIRRLLSISIVLLIGLVGVSFAFFEYYKEGSNQKLTAGQILLFFNDTGQMLKLPNIFPETKIEARKRKDNVITFTVSGINTNTNNDIYYEIMLNEGDPETGRIRFNPSDLVFDLIEVDSLGNETIVVDAMSFSDFNEKRIWVDIIPRGTSSNVSKTYKLRMWLSENVLISDTIADANYTTSMFANSYASVRVSVFGDFEEKTINNQ